MLGRKFASQAHVSGTVTLPSKYRMHSFNGIQFQFRSAQSKSLLLDWYASCVYVCQDSFWSTTTSKHAFVKFLEAKRSKALF